MDYQDAGVNIQAGREFVSRIQELVARTTRPEVLGSLGGFGGFFQLPQGYQAPVLVSGADGVGTKLKLARDLNRHDTVGIDLVAMCVNDVLTCGAEPLFFLDYLATGKLEPEELVQVISGIAEGCQQSGCALLGGETAEMPGFYQPKDYDLAGFCVGIVERDNLLDGSQVALGDIAIGLASRGIHSNGFSLVRKIMQDGLRGDRNLPGWAWEEQPQALGGQSLGDALLTPTQIYVKSVLAARQAGLDIHGMAHITGGGLPENLPRCLGVDQSVVLQPDSWPVPPIFHWIATAGNVSPEVMFDTFNMGIGFVLLVPPSHADSAITWFEDRSINAYPMGHVVAGAKTVLGIPVNSESS
ncbi:phosphoribosylformylglycinamidine cyclo-ligase [Synechococcales cyanobacterium C]|uniref:Phosphoribosylformylglycinamidine cyclo-ligase n=1 Tax=Petrachloros mirabilis ULC683 TaxID=2781853 RepID=A0A8K1ZVX9_9CYAN|nr:phosphoribosylformylglycinamidine cyclo-ligase [Petrachloros mirabilis]NCJ05113.1 phosphoribosylformylglycinamidine cyclo-ligase [Petrachloros mirabilis ULC683]